MKVILISGHAQNGKDTVGFFLKEKFEKENKKVLIIHYADFLKYFCKTYLGWNGEKDQAGRTLLQQWGTNVCRANYEDIWVDMMTALMKGVNTEYDYIIIPDVRFPNELFKIKNNFDTISLRVIRPFFDNGLTEEQKNHISETALDNFDCFDIVLYNDKNLEDLRIKINSLIF